MRPPFSALCAALLACNAIAQEPATSGFSGIWYSNQASDDEYRFKYSGGMATYPQQHHPIAYYAREVDKTFFVYGGVSKSDSLLHMVSFFDHGSGRLAKPVALLDKETKDAHDNPTLMLDDDGFLWVFSNAHGTSRKSYVHRSRRPHSIDAFERVLTTNFSYSQPWYVSGQGWCFLHTRYEKSGRVLYCWRSVDGRDWQDAECLARIEQGHYQVSWRAGKTVGTAFNVHPASKGLNWRTNLYYMQTEDAGRTWRTVSGEKLELPLTARDNPALVHDYASEALLVYLKSVSFDAAGRPVLLFLTSEGYASGPNNDPRTWRIARWTGERWAISTITTSDHNYDFGSLYLEAPDRWRLIAPTEPGPQRYNTGGEMAMWLSADRGATWRRARRLTGESRHNHTYARRPVHAQPGFYALWADGHGRERSASRLLFCTRDGAVFVMPREIDAPLAKPAKLR